MKNQTAVEWLAEKYNLLAWMRIRDEISAGLADEWRKKYLEQALQMEKEQKFNDFVAGQNSTEEGGKSFDQYYIKTYQTDLPPVKNQAETCLSCGYSITVDTQEPYNINRTPNIGESCEPC